MAVTVELRGNVKNFYIFFFATHCSGIRGARCVANKSGRWGRGDREAAAADGGVYLRVRLSLLSGILWFL